MRIFDSIRYKKKIYKLINLKISFLNDRIQKLINNFILKKNFYKIRKIIIIICNIYIIIYCNFRAATIKNIGYI